MRGTTMMMMMMVTHAHHQHQYHDDHDGHDHNDPENHSHCYCHHYQDMHSLKQSRSGVGHSMEEARQTKSTLAFS